jgi:ATP-dependent Clp protease ATP-binding subunit ClpC
MFANVSPRALRVFANARRESSSFQHYFLGTEHILAGLIQDEGGIAGESLALYGVTLEFVREQIDNLVGHGQSTKGCSLTPRAKVVIKEAWDYVHVRGDGCLETEHLLLALCGLEDGLGFKVLLLKLGEETLSNLVTYLGMMVAGRETLVRVGMHVGEDGIS